MSTLKNYLLSIFSLLSVVFYFVFKKLKSDKDKAEDKIDNLNKEIKVKEQLHNNDLQRKEFEIKQKEKVEDIKNIEIALDKIENEIKNEIKDSNSDTNNDFVAVRL